MTIGKPPERKFMIRNLEVIRGNDEWKAKKSKVKEAIKRVLVNLGFELSRPNIEVNEYGYMETTDTTEPKNRYWVTYSVNEAAAEKIQKKRRGITSRMETMNRALYGDDKSKYTILRKYKGVPFEATLRTLRAAARILSRSEHFPESDGFQLKVRKLKIYVIFDEKLVSTITIEQLYDEHREILQKAIKKQSEKNGEYMRKYVENLDKMSKIKVIEEKEEEDMEVDPDPDPMEEVAPEESGFIEEEIAPVEVIPEGSIEAAPRPEKKDPPEDSSPLEFSPDNEVSPVSDLFAGEQ
ncbi:unnamed protein product [Caenorhabditis brenneri]